MFQATNDITTQHGHEAKTTFGLYTSHHRAVQAKTTTGEIGWKEVFGESEVVGTPTKSYGVGRAHAT